MPYISEEEWGRYKAKIDELDKEVDRLKDLLKYVKGASPIIQVSAGKRLDLNDNINAITLLKRVTDAEARLTILETP